jgi:nitrate reductase NapE component
MPESFRGLRKFSCAPILSCGIDKKIRSHHEAHEGHEGFVYFILLNFVLFVLFVTFVVKYLFLLWLRLCCARLFVVINFLTTKDTKHTKEEGRKAYPTDRRLLPRQAVACHLKRLFIVCRFSQLEHLFPNGTRLGFFAGLIERRSELESCAIVIGIADQ